jgi:hypothetical protein
MAGSSPVFRSVIRLWTTPGTDLPCVLVMSARSPCASCRWLGQGARSNPAMRVVLADVGPLIGLPRLQGLQLLRDLFTFLGSPK